MRSFEGNCRRLAAELRAHQQDSDYWEPVSGLLRGILAAAVDRKGRARLPQQARLLATWDVELLVRRLKDVLPMASEPAPSARAPLAPSVLASFLLLGFALSACDTGSPDEALDGAQSVGTGGASSGGASSATGGTSQPGTGGTATATGGTGCPDIDAGSAGAGLAAPTDCSAESGSALWDVIDSSTLCPSAKQELYTCLVRVKSSWCDGLNQLFATRSAEEIASVLDSLLSTCLQCPAEMGVEYDAGVQSRLLEGMLCAVTLYKGVSFPD
jgi:hypothetical protein